jgi:hypothetical protein
MPNNDTSVTIAILSLIVAGGSLIVSIILGILNWRHTSKSFKATQYPVVGIDITDIPVNSHDKFSYLKYQIKNLNGDISLLNVKLIIKIAKPNKTFHFWRKEWLHFHTREWNDIVPGKIVSGEVTLGIEKYLIGNCPSALRKEIPTHYANPPIYYLLRQPLTVRIDLTYLPSVFGIGPIIKYEEYTLIQQYESDDRSEKLTWKIRKDKSVTL